MKTSLGAKFRVPGSRKPATGNESQLVTAILRALHLKGVWAWRVNSSLTVLPAQASHGRRVIKGAPAGTPDILLVIPLTHCLFKKLGSEGEIAGLEQMPVFEPAIGGMRLPLGVLHGLEVKTVTGKQLPSQRAWESKAARHGVGYAVVRSIGEALATVEAWRTGKAQLARP